MIDLLGAATLGGLPLDIAKAAIAKWVGGRLVAGFSATLRNRELKQGRPSKDQQAELAAVIKSAVKLTAFEQFPGKKRLQRKFCKALLAGKRTDWPLAGGSDLGHIVEDVHAWISRNDPQPVSGGEAEDPAAHPYLSVLCRNIIAQFGFRAENNGARNTILHPRWNRFWTTELITDDESDQRSPSEGPTSIGRRPALAAAKLEREADRALAAALNRDQDAPTCLIVSGTAGIGKTQLAAAYAQSRKRRGDVDVLLWVKASSRESVIEAYARAAVKKCGSDRDDVEQAARDFLEWLDDPNGQRWLVILDGFNDADLTDWWPPEDTGFGRTLVTTQRRDVGLDGHGRRRLDIGPFTPAEAQAYLSDRIEHAELLDGAAELARRLGHHPLALSHAAAYILDKFESCRVYLDRMISPFIPLDELSPDRRVDGYEKSVAATWSLAIRDVDDASPRGLGSAILQLISVLDPTGVPVETLQTAPALAYLASQTKSTAGPVPTGPLTGLEVKNTLERLVTLNLVDIDRRHDLLEVQPMLQRVVVESMSESARAKTAWTAANGLLEIWPEPGDDRKVGPLLRANALAVFNVSGDALIRPSFHPVLLQVGQSLGYGGNPEAARSYLTLLLERCRRRLGDDHDDTVLVRGRLARWRGRSGDAAGAIDELRNVLETLRLLPGGPTRTATTIVRRDLAQLQVEAGNPAAAVNEMRGLLTDQERTLGKDDPEVLTTRRILAQMRGETGDHRKAITEFEQLLVDCEGEYTSTHPASLAVRRNLGRWRGESGDARGAVAEFEQLLAIQEESLGPDDRETMVTRQKLARWRKHSGDLAGAIDLLKQLLEQQRGILGDHHADTLATRRDLATARGESGDHDTAISGLEEVLRMQMQRLHERHPLILNTRQVIAHAYLRAERFHQAGEQFTELIADQNQVLGRGSPEALSSRAALARLQGRSGNSAESIAAHREVHEERRRALGEDDPRTLGTLGSIARELGRSGRPDLAVAELKSLLDKQVEVLPSGHRDLRLTRRNLAGWLMRAGEYKEAAEVYESHLSDLLDEFGPDDSDVHRTSAQLAEARSELAYDRYETGDRFRALADLTTAIADWKQVPYGQNRAYQKAKNRRSELERLAGIENDSAVEYEAVLARAVEQLGSGHRYTLIVRRKLATRRLRAGATPQAVKELSRLLEEQQSILACDHHDVQKTRFALALAHAQAGDHAAAAATFEPVTTARPHSSDRRRLLRDRCRLAEWRGRAGDHDRAIDEFENLVDEQRELLGADSRDVERTRWSLALARSGAGDHDGAIADLKALRDHQLRSRSPVHSDVCRTRRELADQYGNSGRPTEAVAELDRLLEDHAETSERHQDRIRAIKEQRARWQAQIDRARS